jgi:hypothetical protein
MDDTTIWCVHFQAFIEGMIQQGSVILHVAGRCLCKAYARAQDDGWNKYQVQLPNSTDFIYHLKAKRTVEKIDANADGTISEAEVRTASADGHILDAQMSLLQHHIIGASKSDHSTEAVTAFVTRQAGASFWERVDKAVEDDNWWSLDEDYKQCMLTNPNLHQSKRLTKCLWTRSTVLAASSDSDLDWRYFRSYGHDADIPGFLRLQHPEVCARIFWHCICAVCAFACSIVTSLNHGLEQIFTPMVTTPACLPCPPCAFCNRSGSATIAAGWGLGQSSQSMYNGLLEGETYIRSES